MISQNDTVCLPFKKLRADNFTAYKCGCEPGHRDNLKRKPDKINQRVRIISTKQIKSIELLLNSLQ